MYRKVLNKLAEWKSSPRRKPLILKGARQVGKTWLMKEFGKQNYEKTFYFSFENDSELQKIFATGIQRTGRYDKPSTVSGGQDK